MTNYPDDSERRPLSTVFDQLIETNLRLTQGVGKLVRVTYGVLACNGILILLVILALWGRR